MNREAILSRLFILTAIGGSLPLGAAYWWVFELFAHFRVQYIVLVLPLTLIAILSRKHLPAVLLAASAALNAWPLVPYLSPAEAASSTAPFSVINLNVNSDNRDHGAVIASLRNASPDLITVLELTPALDQALNDLSDLYPYRFSVPSNDNFGIGILSRHPILAASAFPTGPTTAIDGLIDLPTAELRFLAVHLVPPMGEAMAATRNRQLDELANYVMESNEPLLVCGDFNLTPYSPFFARFTETTGLRDTRLGQGIAISWPTYLPLAGIPIDHCFVRGPVAVSSVERMERMGSDHYPVLVELAWQSEQ